MADEYIKRSNAEKAIREYADIKHNNGDITTANCVLKAVSVLKEIPAADVIEVVYCEDCKHLKFGECEVFHIRAGGTHYCSCGERKAND